MNTTHTNRWEAYAAPSTKYNFIEKKIFYFLVLAVLIGDYLFWQSQPGISFGIYCLFLATSIFMHRTTVLSNKEYAIFGSLFAGALLQSTIKLCFSNVVICICLLVAFSGHTFYKQLGPYWARWAETFIAFKNIFSNWISYISNQRIHAQNNRRSIFSTLQRVVLILFPAFIILIPFSILLGGGNVVLGDLISSTVNACAQWLNAMSLPSFNRILLWFGLASTLLFLIRLPQNKHSSDWWQSKLPTFACREATQLMVFWQSIAILTTVNLLFFLTNSLDVFYLWSNTQLPPDVGHSEYVHQGVYNLIFAVILAASVLTLIFQQAESITRSKLLHSLGIIWIVQNLFLVAGVFLRLKIYVDDYWLTPKRVYVACFLLLVCAGLLFLAKHISANKGLKWLIQRNLVAVFILFYAIQFLHVERWTAQYNFAMWETQPTRQHDVRYYSDLGPEGWPYLINILQSNQYPQAQHLIYGALESAYFELKQNLPHKTWHSFQWHQHGYDQLLLNEFPRLPNPHAPKS